jgi:hypothetical protein
MKIEMGLFGFLTAMLVILKACGVIACSWWWVFSPLWLPFAIWLCAGCALIVFYGVLFTLRILFDWFIKNR